MTKAEVKARHGEIMRAIQNTISVLQPIRNSAGTKNKRVFINPHNVDQLKMKADLIGSAFCKVNVITKDDGLPKGHPSKKLQELVTYEGENYGYEIAPEAICEMQRQTTKVIQCY